MASFAFDTFTTTAQTLTGTETGFIGQNGALWVTGTNAITANGTSNDLVINGTVASSFDAINASCDALDLVVGAQGNILSTGAYGLYANVSSSTEVVNNGTISSGQDTGVGLLASDASVRHTLVNTGTISGEDFGVRVEARGEISTISNSGVIAGGEIGIYGGVFTDAELQVWNTGTITGSVYSFYGNEDDGSGFSSDRVHNAGLMQGDILLFSGDDLYDGIGGLVLGTVDGGAGNDTLIGGNDTETFLGGDGEDLIRGRGGDDKIDGGIGNDTLRGGAGSDEIDGGGNNDIIRGGDGDDDLRGNSGNDELRGDSGSDTLLGDNGNDTLIGGDGNDELKGGNGADLMIGGAGADTFIYTAIAHSPFGGSVDKIRDFTPGEDQIDLSGVVGPDLVFIGTNGFSGTQGEVRYIANATTGNAVVDVDTNGDGTTDLRIGLSNVQSLEQGDFLL